MGMCHSIPDSDPLLQCALQRGVVNSFLCKTTAQTYKEIKQWKQYVFNFGKNMDNCFQVDISTMLHRLMRHVNHQLLWICFIRRYTSEQKELRQKHFKAACTNPNKNVLKIVPQFICSTMNSVEIPDILPDS